MGKSTVSIVLLCLLLFAVVIAGEAAPDREAETPAEIPAGYVGSQVCMSCHEDVVRAFAGTAHAVAPGWDSETGCENCHGPGQAHVDDGEGAGIRNLREITPREASAVCIACHQQQNAQFTLRHGIHDLNDVSCVDCHDSHAHGSKMLRGNGQILCSTCHQAISSQFTLARSHPFSDPDDGCLSCHNPHGSKNHRLALRPGSANCTTCHAEAAGPFLYPHDVSLVDGCSSCHQVHGSTNRHLLNSSRQINLCYQCHSAAETPGFHSAPTFRNEKCTACHTAIHGSNTNPYFLEE